MFGLQSQRRLVQTNVKVLLGITCVIFLLLLCFMQSPPPRTNRNSNAPEYITSDRIERQQANHDNPVTDSIEAFGTISKSFVSISPPLEALPTCSMEQRLKGLRELCEKNYLTIKKKKRIEMLVDHDKRIAYCFIPKTGETSWMVVMANNTKSKRKIPTTKDPKGWIHGAVGNYGLKRTIYCDRLANYTKFMVVRHPLDRVLSAYYDKAFPHLVRQKVWHSLMYSNIRKFAYENFHKNEKIDAKRYNATFVEFVHYILRHSDKHWSDYSHMCGHCHIDYNYILRLETMTHDSVLFLSQYYPKVPSLPAYNSMRTTSATHNIASLKHLAEFEDISSHLVNTLMWKLKYSLQLFGYYFDEETQSAYCSLTNSNGSKCC